ncbi:MFS transporter, partial [Pectobacterium versatile]|nr:MFS transporter [Pectobacterium versatile]
TLWLVDWIGHGDKQLGYQGTMTVMGVLAVIMLIVCFFTTQERINPQVDQGQNVWDDVKNLLSNDQWRIVAVITFFSS